MSVVRIQYCNSGRWYRTRSGGFDRYPLPKRCFFPTTADPGQDLWKPRCSRPECVRQSRNCNLDVQSHGTSELPSLEQSLTWCLTSHEVHEVPPICLADHPRSSPVRNGVRDSSRLFFWFRRGFRSLRCRLIETGISTPRAALTLPHICQETRIFEIFFCMHEGTSLHMPAAIRRRGE